MPASDVAIQFADGAYPTCPPFSPGERFPEYAFSDDAGSAGGNPAYDAVRGAMALLGLDADRFGAKGWNPLGKLIRPGDTVVLKPNFVRDFRETSPDHADCLITHGSIIRAVADYVHIALDGRGRIVIADAPQNDCDYRAVRRITGLDAIQEFYARHAGFDLETYDLRPESARKVDGVIVGHDALPGDPAGYAKVNLGADSHFAEIGDLCHLLYGAEYDTGELRAHHHHDVHEYLVSGTVLEADCVIGLPKLKTHKKAGITVNLKNLVGINGNKNWLPHHREGTPSRGGDQFADDGVKNRVERSTVAGFKRLFPLLGPLRPLIARPIKALGKRLFGDTNTDTIRSGNWYGNDTTWRMVLDLNRILWYADTDGVMHDEPVRRFFSIVDGIVAGEGNGPLDPTPKRAGVVLASTHPVAVDAACARLMGFDYRKIPVLANALESRRYPLDQVRYGQIRCRSNRPDYDRRLDQFEGECLAFKPHFGWVGHVEHVERRAAQHAETRA